MAAGRDTLTNPRWRRSGDEAEDTASQQNENTALRSKCSCSEGHVQSTDGQCVGWVDGWVVDTAQDASVRQWLGSPLCFVLFLRLQCTRSLRCLFTCSSKVRQPQRELLWRSYVCPRLTAPSERHARLWVCVCVGAQHSKSQQLWCFQCDLIRF